jgi:hypothetical protein
MARIRTIKPDLFKHEDLFDLEAETGLPIRFAWAGLFTICDREGRFKWRPRSIKAEVLPFDDIDFSRVLHALATRGFLVVYACSGELYGSIPSFKAHQVINAKERASNIPSPSSDESTIINDFDTLLTRGSRVGHALSTGDQPCTEISVGKGKERKGKERKGKDRKSVV